MPESAPRLSWTVQTPFPGWRRAVYGITADAPRGTTGRVASDQSVRRRLAVRTPWRPVSASRCGSESGAVIRSPL
jgi:hypothetical protein